MKITSSHFASSEACASTPASPKLSFKSALSEAERLIEQQGAIFAPSPGSFARCNDPQESASAATAGLDTAMASTCCDAGPIGAEPAADMPANGPDGARHWTRPLRATASQLRTPTSSQGDNAATFTPRIGRSLVQTQAGEFKDDGRRPLGFAEPGVIRSLRPALGQFDSPLQRPANEAWPATAPPQIDVEHPQHTEPTKSADQFTLPPSNVDLATRHPGALRVSSFAVVGARPSHALAPAGAANVVAPARGGEQGVAPHRAASSKAQLPRLPARQQQGASIILHEMAGALDLIVGVAGATPELRVRLKPALAALAADYGLRIAHMTLNGVSVERATGSKGG